MSTTSREAPLLPVSDARESALFFVVCALCFLAAMAALSARATYGAAADWTSEVEGELTVRLIDVDSRSARDAEKIVADMSSVESARLIEREEAAELLAPWFGRDGLPASLPLPVLIEVSTVLNSGRIGPDIERQLTEAGIDSRIDDHADWAGDVRRSLGTVRLVALGAVALLAATAIAVIAFATHAALLARRDIVDVLHLSGAEDRFIANLFERRFWILGLQAGAVGALAALGGVALMLFSANSATVDRPWLLPRLSLDLWDIIILLLAPIVAGFAARTAARITVVRSLAGTV
ncbi:MAG: cell division protein FtsX [Pseudomonadota bacterium]